MMYWIAVNMPYLLPGLFAVAGILVIYGNYLMWKNEEDN